MVSAIWLIVILWRRLREADGEPAILSTIALVSGVSAITVTMAASGFHVVLALEVNDPLDPIAGAPALRPRRQHAVLHPVRAHRPVRGDRRGRAANGDASPLARHRAGLLAVLQPPSALAMFEPLVPGALFGGVTIILLMAWWTLALTVVLMLDDRRRSRLVPRVAAGDA